jgi:hypothetical protein
VCEKCAVSLVVWRPAASRHNETGAEVVEVGGLFTKGRSVHLVPPLRSSLCSPTSDSSNGTYVLSGPCLAVVLEFGGTGELLDRLIGTWGIRMLTLNFRIPLTRPLLSRRSFSWISR